MVQISRPPVVQRLHSPHPSIAHRSFVVRAFAPLIQRIAHPNRHAFVKQTAAMADDSLLARLERQAVSCQEPNGIRSEIPPLFTFDLSYICFISQRQEHPELSLAYGEEEDEAEALVKAHSLASVKALRRPSIPTSISSDSNTESDDAASEANDADNDQTVDQTMAEPADQTEQEQSAVIDVGSDSESDDSDDSACVSLVCIDTYALV